MPNRIIREGILTSKHMAQLGWAEEVFFRRLMSVVDDFGRYHADAGLLRAACYPRQLTKVSDSDVGKWLRACEDAALVRVYPAEDGDSYLEMLRFNQQVRAKKSKFPDPVVTRAADATQTQSMCDASAHLDVSVSEDVFEDVIAPTVLVPDPEKPGSDDPPSKVYEIPDCPAKEIVEIFHEILPELPRVERLTDARRAHMRQRWKEWAVEKRWQSSEDGLADWRKFFGYVRKSNFLMGKTKPRPPRTMPFVADIDFLMAPGAHLKIFEGKYHEA